MISALKLLGKWMGMGTKEEQPPVTEHAVQPDVGAERRLEVRYVDTGSTVVTIIDDAHQQSASARVLDATTSGMRVTCAERLEPGSMVRCSLQVNRRVRVALMRVQWRRATDAGFLYGFLCPNMEYSQNFLREYIDFLIAEAAEIDVDAA